MASDDHGEVSARFGSGGTSAGQARRVPFRIVVAGDFGLPSGRLHDLEQQDLEELLAAAAPRLDLVVRDHLTGGDRPLAVTLPVSALRDFTPRRLLENVPALAAAMAVRDRLRAGTAPDEAFADLPGLRHVATSPPMPSEAQESGPENTPALPQAADTGAPSPGGDAPTSDGPTEDGDDPLDRILGMVDTGESGSPPPTREDDVAKRAVSAFVGSMGRRQTSKPQTPAAGGDISAVERVIAAQLSEIVDAPEFRTMESAWLGLRFLLRHCDRRGHCFLHLISAPKETAAETLREVLVDASDQQPAGIGLIVSAHEYGSGPGDIARLQALAGIGAEIQVPALAASAPDFIHSIDDAELARHRDPETIFLDAAYEPWSSLRAKSVARWLGVTMNRFRLRGPHDLIHDRRVGFATASKATRVGSACEVGGAWMVAALVGDSVAATDRPTELTGAGRAIDGLALYDDGGDAANVFAVRTALRPDAAASLANAGLIALVGQPNTDVALVVRAPSVHSARANPTGDLPREGGLDYQLLVSRLIRQIEGNADLILGAPSTEGVRDAMQVFLSGLLGPAADVRVSAETEDEQPVLVLNVTTGRDILGGVSVHLDLPV